MRIVFFSFDYDDIFRVNQVRQSGRFIGEKRAGFRDKAEYERVKQSGDSAVESWIAKQMAGCSVTCVLIGENTWKSRWVAHEIHQAQRKGMGILGVNLHRLRVANQEPSNAFVELFADPPKNPISNTLHRQNLFENFQIAHKYCIYDWFPAPRNPLQSLLADQNSLSEWVELAARRAGLPARTLRN